MKKYPKIGFGAWGLAGDAYGSISSSQGLEVLRHAYDNGVRFFDTSDSYGDGRSERIIGSFVEHIKTKRDELFIATKGGLLPHKTFYMPTNFSAEYIEERISNSLKNLKTDYIDLYQLHSPEKHHIIENDELLTMLSKKKKEGVIKKVGVSVRQPKDFIPISNHYDFDYVQLNYNIIDHRLDDLIETGFNFKSTKVIARTPFAFGYLTGKITHLDILEDGDHRKKWPIDQIKKWESAVNEFKEFNYEYQLNPVLTALIFCMSNPKVDVVIPGMMTTDQVSENLIAQQCKLFDNEQLRKIKDIYKSIDWFDKNAKKD